MDESVEIVLPFTALKSHERMIYHAVTRCPPEVVESLCDVLASMNYVNLCKDKISLLVFKIKKFKAEHFLLSKEVPDAHNVIIEFVLRDCLGPDYKIKSM